MRVAQRIATTALGIVLAVTPAVLWIAWTPGLVIAAMAISIVCAWLLVLLTESSPSRADIKEERVALPDGFIDEVHRLFPLTYHHSAAGPSRFRRAMARLSQELRKSR